MITKSMKKSFVTMEKNINGDTRSADHIPTIQEFFISNDNHRNDVKKLVSRFCEMLEYSAKDHDITKTVEPHRSVFYRDMVDSMNGRLNFTDGEWYKHHIQYERHHLNNCVPDDVDLFDVIEMICDCVCAGMTRHGDVRPVEIKNEVLQKAIENTVEILKNQINLVDES